MDARLHDYFIEASRKRRLIAILHQMSRLIERFRELGFKASRTRDVAVEEHIELIDALCVRDVEKALDVLAKHIERSKTDAISLLVRSGGPSVVRT